MYFLNFKQFLNLKGLIITGWSRYDHLAVLCELFPIGIPSLSMSVETILAGRKLNGQYEKTSKLLHCDPPHKPGFTYGCEFPGRRVFYYFLIFGHLSLRFFLK
jgi:hypothetical protein